MRRGAFVCDFVEDVFFADDVRRCGASDHSASHLLQCSAASGRPTFSVQDCT